MNQVFCKHFRFFVVKMRFLLHFTLVLRFKISSKFYYYFQTSNMNIVCSMNMTVVWIYCLHIRILSFLMSALQILKYHQNWNISFIWSNDYFFRRQVRIKHHPDNTFLMITLGNMNYLTHINFLPRHRNTGLVSSGASLTSWGEDLFSLGWPPF